MKVNYLILLFSFVEKVKRRSPPPYEYLGQFPVLVVVRREIVHQRLDAVQVGLAHQRQTLRLDLRSGGWILFMPRNKGR